MKGFFRANGGLLVVAAVLLAALLAIVSAITGVNPITSAVRILTNPVGSRGRKTASLHTTICWRKMRS